MGLLPSAFAAYGARIFKVNFALFGLYRIKCINTAVHRLGFTVSLQLARWNVLVHVATFA